MAVSLDEVLQKTHQLMRIERCIPRIIGRLGKVEWEKEHDCYTESLSTLRNNGGFDFSHRGSFTMFGGDNISISYNGVEVLNLDYWEIDRPHVRKYSGGSWETVLEPILLEEERLIQQEELRERLKRERASKAEADAETLRTFSRSLEERRRELGAYLSR